MQDKTNLYLFHLLLGYTPGWRRPDQLTFDLKPALESKNIRFINAALLEIKPEQNLFLTKGGNFKYDYLVIAAGPHFDWEEVFFYLYYSRAISRPFWNRRNGKGPANG